MRAYRRAGELMKQFDARGKTDPEVNSSRTEVARNAGFTERQQSTAVRLANVPEDDFNKQVDSENPPTIKKLADQGKSKYADSLVYAEKPPGFANTIYFIGSCRDLAESMEKDDPLYIIGGMFPKEDGIKKMKKYIKIMENWIDTFMINV